jgi:site-specific DNA-adenine methylase
MTLKAPFPWFGGKSKVAPFVWPRFGDTLNYVEPFAGSLAVLLNRPFPVRIETVNDADAFLANFWRALQHDPDGVAYYADWPVDEADLHARHRWLVGNVAFREAMMSDPDYFDVKVAGWWVWGLSAWIGSGWCRQEGNLEMKRPDMKRGGGRGVHRAHQRPNLRPHQGVQSVPMQIPHLQGDSGASGQGINAGYIRSDLYDYLAALAGRLRRVRVICGDWTRVMGRSVTWKIGTTAVFLDPPYSHEKRQEGLYAKDSMTIAREVRAWCLENGGNPKLRIALCGYEGEHDELESAGWDVAAWKANGGYDGQRRDGTNNNKHRERIWFSPHCLKPLEVAFAQAKIGGEADFVGLPLFPGRNGSGR